MNQRFNLLFLSNMIEGKGVWTIVEAAEILQRRGFDFECHFVGGWGDLTEESFVAKINKQNLQDVVFAHGPKFGNEKESFWRNADLFVFPTFYRNECFPLVLLEAMQHRLACISTNEGGIPDIIDEGLTGYIIEKNDASALAEKVEFLLLHPGVCREMGERGYKKYLSEYTLERFENRLCEILTDLLNR